MVASQTGMMMGYFIGALVVGLGWGGWIFYIFKILEWHEIKDGSSIE